MKIVISGVNINTGGALSILQECLGSFDSTNYNVIALVYDRKLFPVYTNIKLIEYKFPKRSYLLRFFFEYVYCFFLSIRLKPDVWFSIHDMTPNVKAKVRAVYCHNTAPFYEMSELEKKLDKKMWLFNLFYKYVYKININKNDYVVVQQNWLADRFVREYELNPNKMIVAKPEVIIDCLEVAPKVREHSNVKQFFYPSFPRSFKNFEVICEASNAVVHRGYENFEIIFTIAGNENLYANYIFKKYNNIPNIKFIGLISREEVFNYYRSSDCLIFPSKLESWGLPLSEYSNYQKPMLVADLPYARETVGEYKKVRYFNPANANQLADLMIDVIENREIRTESQVNKDSYDRVKSWQGLFRKICSGVS